MRYKGYVVTYAGELLKVNRENYFLNGICREEFEQSDVYEVNKEFRRRNLYAVSSGAKCDEAGDELAFIAVDVMKGFYKVDFAKENRSYFNMANSAISSYMFERSTEHFEVDTSILYIDNDIATVYNIGDMPVFYYEKGKLRKVSGNAPETVEIEEKVHDTRLVKKANIPYLGYLNDECETVPYVSQKIKLKKIAYFVLCSKAIFDIVGEKNIESVLADRRIKSKDKAARIIDMAIEKKPDGNYTVQVVKVGKGIPITGADARSVGIWLAILLLCAGLYFSSSYIFQAISGMVDSSKAFIESHMNKEDEPSEDLIWIPKDNNGEEQHSENSEKKEENDEQSNDDVSTAVITTPQSGNTSKPQRPATSPQTSSVQSQPKVQTPAESKPEVELPGTTAPSETKEDVELPIDFN